MPHIKNDSIMTEGCFVLKPPSGVWGLSPLHLFEYSPQNFFNIISSYYLDLKSV
jgi:hypothetical protein